MSELRADVVVVGSGVAGMSVALGLARTRDVLVVDNGDGSTRWAQGGIAVALAADSPAAHAHDTERAGAGRCDPRAVARLVEEGPLRLAELIGRGARLDRDDHGRLLLSREGGHERARVVHAGGDATGAEVWRTLHDSAARVGLRRLTDTRVDGLLLTSGAVTGVVATSPRGPARVRADAVVLATGGVGHVYDATTNPVAVRGTGIALAILAGARLSGLEFVQFHPTALAVGGANGQATGRLPLVSEALRGAGAVLRRSDGRPLMPGLHPLADLAPRDVVAAAIHRAMREGGAGHVWLDCREVADVGERFPGADRACRAIGVDVRRDLVPVRPAQHFLCGGVSTDAWGATTVPGLYAVGEVADAGCHGANRLASNALLEGLVYGARVAAALTLELPSRPAGATTASVLRHDGDLARTARGLMSAHAGVERTSAGLDHAHGWLTDHADRDVTCRVGAAVVAAARRRTESVGCHRREAAAPLPSTSGAAR